MACLHGLGRRTDLFRVTESCDGFAVLSNLDARLSSGYRTTCFFFFQAEDGIRDVAVTGVQTCALPICWNAAAERIQGYRAHEIMGEHFSTFYPPDDVAQGKPQWALEIAEREGRHEDEGDRKSTRLNSSHGYISYAVFCLKKKKTAQSHG